MNEKENRMQKQYLLITLLFIFIELFAHTAIMPSVGDGTENNPYQIATWQNLYWLSQNPAHWDKYYKQVENIDFADASPAINTWDNNAGWTPIGNQELNFTGYYNGNYKSISNLYINRPENDFIGFFGFSHGILETINLINVNIIGYNWTGGLVGCNSRFINYCSTSGFIQGVVDTGGLIGANTEDIFESFSTASVNGSYCTGGLIGSNYGDNTITKCYSTGNINGSVKAGGLIGEHLGFMIKDCYSTSNVSGQSYIGGFSGFNISHIANCYSIGNVVGNQNTGGFIGESNEFATVINCYWNTETSGQTISDGGIGKTTLDMKDISTFSNAGWIFPDIWNIDSNINNGYPYLNFPNSVETDDIVITPTDFSTAILNNAYPNPFNPSTTLSFELSIPQNIELTIFNIKGQCVKSLINAFYNIGKHSIIWEGKDNNNNSCPSGIYFYRLKSDTLIQTKKMMLVK